MEKRLFFIFLGTAAALLLSLVRRKKYGYSLLKVILTTVLFMSMAVIGALGMGILEGGMVGNISLYGSIFVIPVSIVVFCIFSKENTNKMLDFFVPQICGGLAPVKLLCLSAGCCYGIKLFEKADGTIARFPSQIVELCASLVIMLLFLYFEKKDLFVGKHYPIFLIVYGISRFVLNSLRGETSPFVWVFPAGHFWSIVAITIGLLWLLLEQKEEPECEITE